MIRITGKVRPGWVLAASVDGDKIEIIADRWFLFRLSIICLLATIFIRRAQHEPRCGDMEA